MVLEVRTLTPHSTGELRRYYGLMFSTRIKSFRGHFDSIVRGLILITKDHGTKAFEARDTPSENGVKVTPEKKAKRRCAPFSRWSSVDSMIRLGNGCHVVRRLISSFYSIHDISTVNTSCSSLMATAGIIPASRNPAQTRIRWSNSCTIVTGSISFLNSIYDSPTIGDLCSFLSATPRLHPVPTIFAEMLVCRYHFDAIVRSRISSFYSIHDDVTVTSSFFKVATVATLLDALFPFPASTI